jgi:FkbM family methyltransferase
MLRSVLDFIGRKVRRGIRHLAGFWNLWYLGEQHQLQIAALQSQIDQLGETISRLQTYDSNFSRIVAAEIDRLDGYLVYHAGALSQQTDELMSKLEAIRENFSGIVETNINRLDSCLASRLGTLSQQVSELNKLSYVQADLDALLVTGEFDLLVPTSETGLLAYLIRHGVEAVEPGVRAVLQTRLRAGATAVDIGASIGLHALTMAQIVGPGGRVICIEPLPHIASALERTLRLNGFGDRSQVICSAAADSVGDAMLYCASHSPTSSLFPIPEKSASITVRTISLDDHFAPGERVDMVKIDVEGAEPLVYKGMSRILRENPKIELILEWSASHFVRSKQSPELFWDLIRRDGFEPLLIDDERPDRLVALQEAATVPNVANILLTRN